MGQTPTIIHLFRHGAVSSDWHGRVYGRLDVPLSEVGQEEARWGAATLRRTGLRSVVSSGLARAEYTAELLRNGRDLARCDEPALLEIDRGSWAGASAEEIDGLAGPGAFEAWRASGGVLAPPGGETIQAMASRVHPAVDQLAARAGGGRLAIVAHMWVLKLTVLRALGEPCHRAGGLQVPTGTRADFEWSDGRLRLTGVAAPDGQEVGYMGRILPRGEDPAEEGSSGAL